MEIASTKISVRGKVVAVPSADIAGREIVVTGRWLKIAAVKDEDWLEANSIDDPNIFIGALKEFQPKPDIFTFAQQLHDPEPKYPFHLEWDNVAAVPLTSYSDWWENRLPQVSRKNVRRAAKRGVTVQLTPFNDSLVEGIRRLYNETPIRQGRRFWHYGEDFETVKRENSSYLDRSDFVVAYYNEEIIGFLKIVHVGKIARIMQILSLNDHFDKRPANALISKAIEVSCAKGASHFVYGKYVYGNKVNSPLTEFKRRNGFEQILIPKYYVPLTVKGRVAIALKLHLPANRIIPEKLLTFLVNTRSKLYERRLTQNLVKKRDSGTGHSLSNENPED